MLHKRFTQAYLLITCLANLTKNFQLSFITWQFLSKQHKVVYSQFMQIEPDGSTIISLKVVNKQQISSQLK